MKKGFRQSMAWLHTWAGLFVGWVLYLIFLTGTLGYFDTEIDRWMRPELPLDVPDISQREGAAVGLARVMTEAPGADRWIVYPPSGHDVSNVNVFWTSSGSGGLPTRHSEELDASTGLPLAARATGGGQALYQLHYLLHYMPSRVAYWLVGICTMFMLTAIVSGIVTHRRIFRDFFTFRPGRGQRSWLDMHNVLSVLALPFHLMITYSGLVFFAFTYMTFTIVAVYGAGDRNRQQFFDEGFHNPVLPEPAGIAAPMVSIDVFIDAAEARWGNDQIRSIDTRSAGDRNARVIVTRNHQTPVSNGGRMVFDGVSGALLDEYPQRQGPLAVNDALLSLHEGLFAGAGLRWLYFLSGLLGTAMIGTGLVLWTVKRTATDECSSHVGLRLVERLNVATIVGLPAAIAAYFWANRLLPAALEGRAEWEMHVLFIVWGAAFCHALLRTPARIWFEQSVFAAAAIGLLPVLNAMTSELHLLRSVPAGQWDLAGFDLAALAFGIGFAVLSRRLARRQALVARGSVTNAESADSWQRPIRPGTDHGPGTEAV